MHSLSDLCFLCLIRSKNIISVLTESEDDIVIEEKLECVLSELVNFRPEIPKNICSDCLKGLNFAYKFKQKCLENLISLSDYLDKLAENETSKAVTTETQPEKEQEQTKKDQQNVATINETDNKTKQFVCNICHKNFVQISHLKDHILIHTGHKPYNCQICEYKCTRLTSLKRHMKIHKADTCKYCQKTFSNASYLKRHLQKRHHNDDKATGSKSIVERQENEDVLVNIVPKEFHEVGEIKGDEMEEACESKDMIQNEEIELEKLHKDGEIKDEEMKEECGLKDETENEDISNAASPNCAACLETYQPDHICSPHTSEKPHICEVCNKTFNNITVLSKHKQIHTEENLYKCEFCNMIFRKISELIIHKQHIHSDIRPYKCTVCNKTFVTITERNSHMTTHISEKPYECKVCEKAFSSMSALIYHRRSHYNLMPYKCTECVRTFTQRAHLTSHMKAHSGNKPHKCHLCEVRFRLAHHLKNHMKTHTNEGSEVVNN